MAKEETGKVEERLDKLEAEQLKIAREFGKQCVAFFLTLTGMRVAASNKDKQKYFEGFMRFKIEEAEKCIDGAQDVEEAISLTGKFNDECLTCAESLLNK
jgi:hypothetical protein